MEYGFVEQWMIREMECEHTPYNIPGAGMAVLVDKQTFEAIFRALVIVSDKQQSFEPSILDSNVNGIKLILHRFWFNHNILDSITGEDVKSTGSYELLKNLGGSSTISKDDVVSDFSEAINGDSDDSQDADVVDVEEVAETTDEELFIEHVIVTLKLYMPEIEIEDCGDKKIIYATNDKYYDVECFTDFCKSTGKNIIILDYNGSDRIISKIFNNYSKVDAEEHSLIISSAPALTYISSKFSRASRNSVHTCLGQNINTLYVTNSSKEVRINQIKQDSDISSEEKLEMIEDIKNEESCFSHYDSIYKDSVTNVIWGLKDRCIITIMFPYANNVDAYFLCMRLLGIRLKGDLSRKDLNKLDEEFYSKSKEKDAERYVSFVVQNASNIIDKLKASKDDAIKKYEKAVAEAEEFGKLYNKLDSQIQAFDEEKFKESEHKRAVESYWETLNIPKVRSISINDNMINVYTENIYCKDDRSGKWHDIGTFHISIGMESNSYNPESTIKIINTKHSTSAYQSNMQAPHVFSSGKMCPGNAATMISQCYVKRNLHDLIYSLTIFLESVNTSDSAGAFINEWPVVTEDIVLGKKEDDSVEEKDEVEETFDEMLAEYIP